MVKNTIKIVYICIMKCRSCKKSIPANAKYCPHCGKAQHFNLFRFITRLIALLSLIFAVTCAVLTYRYRINIYQHLFNSTQDKASEKAKIDAVFDTNKKGIFGIDVSQYQGNIQWEKVKAFEQGPTINFVFIRASMGSTGKDTKFKENWRNAKKQGIIRGAYHYYRPDENSLKQAANFIQMVDLTKGDLIPVLDIEEIATKQPIDKLRLGLKRWLTKIEAHYGVKPMIYSSDAFYTLYLQTGDFDDYPIWIANYNRVKSPWTNNWELWQFTEQGTIKGINHTVDFNVYDGDKADFNTLIIQ